MFLYEQIEQAKTYGMYRELPNFISDNLNPKFQLRDYQKKAFQNYITYFENKILRSKSSQVLFHMATGSGKTLIMAGLMIYLYKQGYRNFLFFVNLSNIVEKTKDNFLNSRSSKYLFADEISIDGERVPVREVSNFQYAKDDGINISFSTTQGLHHDMWSVKENSMSYEDFDNRKVVLISDEAHHLNASTRNMNREESESYHSWEYTVNNIFKRNPDNVLLEFTATCDLSNKAIFDSYESKIVFDYPLKNFYREKYSKEIITFQSDISLMDRALQALILSQYRMKVFQDNRLSIKPIVLFKSKYIDESKAFMKRFVYEIKNLTGNRLEQLPRYASNIMNTAFEYFSKKGISLDMLAQELREDFSEDHCLSVNVDKELDNLQIILNSLEDKNNPYRAVFEVQKLDEGWDVLNLFDIVRLYETRQSGDKKLSPYTIAEAQLIGRGARYCPFSIDDEQPIFQRKYDNDITNEMRICEELYYHCQKDSRYIHEIHSALKEIGLEVDKTVSREYVLKEEFKEDDLYKKGFIFKNRRVLNDRKEIKGLLPSVKDKVYHVETLSGFSSEEIAMGGKSTGIDVNVETYTLRISINEIVAINYAIVHKALMKHSIFKFNTLKSYFPNLKSTREFITSPEYLGNIQLDIKSREKEIPVGILHEAVCNVIEKIASHISGIQETYKGSDEFYVENIKNVFKDKTVNYTDPQGGGVGVSQKDYYVNNEWRMDLSKEDWFAYTDNFGTSEEKAFVAYFKKYVEDLKREYEKVYLVRNERAFCIYSFEGGERFEPDYILFLRKNKEDGFEQMQIFIEPKGSHLLEKDAWKESFLLEMKNRAIPVKRFVDDNKYSIWGFHFFNTENRMKEFYEDMDSIINSKEYSIPPAKFYKVAEPN